MPHTYVTVAEHDGYCARCDVERPLVIQSHGAHGLRAWLAGIGWEDRALSYTCRVCGQVEHVPLTEAEDDEYAATLVSWPDWAPVQVPVVVQLPEPVVVRAGDVFALAATQLALVPALPAPRKPVVRIITLPHARVAATDGQPLATLVA